MAMAVYDRVSGWRLDQNSRGKGTEWNWHKVVSAIQATVKVMSYVVVWDLTQDN